MRKRQIHLGVFIYPGGHHIMAWRDKAMQAGRITELGYYQECGRLAERGLFDLFFVGDALNAREREGRIMEQVAINNLDPVSIVSAVGAVTERIGLGATLSTTYNDPFAIAQKFATLDHLSAGRAAWNIVTTQDKEAAANFSRDAAMDKNLRYERAAEFVALCKSLWQSWDDTAAHPTATSFTDPARIHDVHHHGRFFDFDGHLGMPRPPQTWPVLLQAGDSEPGREFAGQVAEAIFTGQTQLEGAKSFRADIHARLAKYGRPPESCQIMPGLSPLLASTEQEALRREKEMSDLVDPITGVWMLSQTTGFRLYDHDLDAPMPTAEIRAAIPTLSRNGRNMVERAERDRLSLREAARIMARSRVHQSFVGTPEQLAAHMARWVQEGGCEGFNILPPVFPNDLALFVDEVVPLIQRMGVYRRAYEGSTLRDHLGLTRPA